MQSAGREWLICLCWILDFRTKDAGKGVGESATEKIGIGHFFYDDGCIIFCGGPSSVHGDASPTSGRNRELTGIGITYRRLLVAALDFLIAPWAISSFSCFALPC